MTQAPVASGLVRVTVASGSRRVDLVLPGAVPVAELVPELARSVGLLDPSTVYGGYRLVTADGRELATDAGLVSQGVEDGGLITVAAGVDDEAPRVYDDVVEAMTDIVEHDLRPWSPAAGRRTALWAAGLFMSLGAVALLIQRDSVLAGVAAVVGSAALVTGAIVLSRAQREPEAAVAVAWMGALYAAVAGLMLVTDQPFFGPPVAVSATVGLLLVLIAPLAVSLGLSGAIVAVLCCAVVMLRTRQYRTGPEVLVGLVSGIVGLLSTAVAALWVHPDWRPTIAVVLAASGALLLAVTLLPATPSVRRGRLGDVAESVALLALIPVTVVAVGVFSAIRG